ncbi:hypothetical protein RHSIM_Rhsim07G0168700 [Rhododendron simsii]|uniref:FAR1 domain-containing protein n=1 Tax=Rhododendron simsii TaxID=118357 RepID=A0A834GV44_RHOSS|nr:hypothetical protein RHSIM_Rhsim07G0168700 [Rhododendron simsii]
MYVKCSGPCIAEKVFGEASIRDVVSWDVVPWNKIIGALTKNRDIFEGSALVESACSEALDNVEVRDTETPDNNVEGFKIPTIGMYFETIEEARNYYERYGQENGSSIRTRGSDKGRNRSNEVTRVRFVCTKEGNYAAKKQQESVQPLNVDVVDEEEKVISKKRVRNCSTIKCGCKAYLRIIHDKWNGKWKVTGFDESHNHPLVTPMKSKDDELEQFEVILDSQTYEEVSKVSPIEICAEKDVEKSTEPSPSQILLLDPNISICKGRKNDVKGKAATTQSERLKSGIEMSLNKKKRKCHMCFQFEHDKRICPSNPMRKTNKDLEEEVEGSDSDQEEGTECSE